MSGERQVNIKSQSELDIGGCETLIGILLISDLRIYGFMDGLGLELSPRTWTFRFELVNN